MNNFTLYRKRKNDFDDIFDNLNDSHKISKYNTKYQDIFDIAEYYATTQQYDKAEKCYIYLINNKQIIAVYLLSKMLDEQEQFFYYKC